MNGTSETDTETEKLKGFIVYKRLRLFIKRDRQTETERLKGFIVYKCLRFFIKRDRQTETQRELGKERS